MYYKGIPFKDHNKILVIPNNSSESFFICKEISTSFTKKVYERFLENKIDLVVYHNVEWNNLELMEFHSINYPNIPYYAESQLTEYVFKTTIVDKSNVIGYSIILYDDIWRNSIEQIFDERHLLLEYRHLFYESNNRIPNSEKIFFSSWHISEEKF
jgi:hypothetical protein